MKSYLRHVLVIVLCLFYGSYALLTGKLLTRHMDISIDNQSAWYWSVIGVCALLVLINGYQIRQKSREFKTSGEADN